MEPLTVFFIQLAGTFTLMSCAAAWWVMPRLRKLPLPEALSIALFPGAIRYFGTLMLVPALAPNPHSDLVGAWLDVAVSLVAFAGILANRAGWPSGRWWAWTYAVVGGTDMMVTFVRGTLSGTWGNLTGGWIFVVAVFPAVGVGLALTFILLISHPATAPAASNAVSNTAVSNKEVFQ